jgi:hypothetical protein
MAPWQAKSEEISWTRKTEVKVAITDTDPVNARILKLATDLGNTVLAKKAANDLQASVPFFELNKGFTDTIAIVSSLRKCLDLAGLRYSTKSCKFWRHITSAFRHVDLFWICSTSGSWSRLCSRRRTSKKRKKAASLNRTQSLSKLR